MTLREKYGEWGVIFGATDGLGKAFSERIASEGMSVVLVGRREDKLNELGKELAEKHGVEYKVAKCDLSIDGEIEKVFDMTRDLDMGFMSYIACLHQFGKIQDTAWERHQAMLNVNINSFLKAFYHYMGVFTKQDRGAIVNLSSLTGVSSSPYNAQYGAGKAYIIKMTEAVAHEVRNTNVDVMVATLGTTLTPTSLQNLPQGPAGEAVVKRAMTPEQCVDEVFENLGKVYSLITGENNRAAVKKWQTEMTTDEVISYMGSFYEID